MTAIVFMNNNLLTGENDWLGAFAGGEIRGIQEAFLNELPISEYYGDYIFPIQLYANIDGEEFSFLFYDFSAGEEEEIVTNYTFLSNDVPGDLTDPIPLYLQELSNNAISNQNFQLISIYPNPFNSEIWVSYHVNTPSEVGIKVFDISGRLVGELGYNWYNAGDFNISWMGDFPTVNYYIMV